MQCENYFLKRMKIFDFSPGVTVSNSAKRQVK